MKLERYIKKVFILCAFFVHALVFFLKFVGFNLQDEHEADEGSGDKDKAAGHVARSGTSINGSRRNGRVTAAAAGTTARRSRGIRRVSRRGRARWVSRAG